MVVELGVLLGWWIMVFVVIRGDSLLVREKGRAEEPRPLRTLMDQINKDLNNGPDDTI